MWRSKQNPIILHHKHLGMWFQRSGQMLSHPCTTWDNAGLKWKITKHMNMQVFFPFNPHRMHETEICKSYIISFKGIPQIFPKQVLKLASCDREGSWQSLHEPWYCRWQITRNINMIKLPKKTCIHWSYTDLSVDRNASSRAA